LGALGEPHEEEQLELISTAYSPVPKGQIRLLLRLFRPKGGTKRKTKK